jgi:UDP-N-acetylglucosamine 4,6-dehydratase
MINNDSAILITGGTGSFGKAFVNTILNLYPKIKRLVIFSRDELKQYEMMQELNLVEHQGVRFFLGDVRDYSRLVEALQGIDIVVHAAALKQVPAAEYNPFEFVKTNVLGAENLIRACFNSSVRNVVALSTDKAASPINLYGATKLCSDKLFIAANNFRGSKGVRLAVVRYGNVMGSRGSVIPFFLERRKTGVLPITDLEMTRFSISVHEGVQMVLWTLKNMLGGEIFVPKIPSYRIVDVAEAVGPECEHRVVGIRPGEKVHEEMITVSDSYNTVDYGSYYAILPQSGLWMKEEYCAKTTAKCIEKGFSYNSGTNPEFLTVAEIRKLIFKNIDKNFGGLK